MPLAPEELLSNEFTESHLWHNDPCFPEKTVKRILSDFHLQASAEFDRKLKAGDDVDQLLAHDLEVIYIPPVSFFFTNSSENGFRLEMLVSSHANGIAGNGLDYPLDTPLETVVDDYNLRTNQGIFVDDHFSIEIPHIPVEQDNQYVCFSTVSVPITEKEHIAEIMEWVMTEEGQKHFIDFVDSQDVWCSPQFPLSTIMATLESYTTSLYSRSERSQISSSENSQWWNLNKLLKEKPVDFRFVKKEDLLTLVSLVRMQKAFTNEGSEELSLPDIKQSFVSKILENGECNKSFHVVLEQSEVVFKNKYEAYESTVLPIHSADVPIIMDWLNTKEGRRYLIDLDKINEMKAS